jgi:hypothetical protein
MREEFISTLVELSKIFEETELERAYRAPAAIVEEFMGLMEEHGAPITRETLLRQFKMALEHYREIESKKGK